MKCSGCGAEIPESAKFCEYCGSQISYEMRREQEQLNKAGCPKCHSSNIQFKRENQGEVRGKKSKRVIHRTVGFCNDCGYTWYPDSASGALNGVPEKSNLKWWVLGWIFFFPAPVMILIWRKKNTWNIKVKIGVTVAFWILFFTIGAFGDKSDSNEQKSYNLRSEPQESIDNGEKDSEPVVTEYEIIDAFIEEYNATAENKLSNPTEIDIQASEHYRTEYRLNAFKNAVAKQCSISDTVVDIVNYGGLSNDSIRMYLTTDNEELAISFFDTAAKVLDSSATDQMISEANDNIRDESNGNYLNDISYYFSKIQHSLFIDAKANFKTK